MKKTLRATVLDICVFAHFKVNCEFVPLRSFANFELVMSRAISFAVKK